MGTSETAMVQAEVATEEKRLPAGDEIRSGKSLSDTCASTKRQDTTPLGETYGDTKKAEEYGSVARGLKSRHVQFIALGGSIGTGIFLGIGIALTQAGPLSLLIGYILTGVAVFCLMQCLGEMATWLPLPGAIPQYCTRYVDDALGFAVGWNNWYSSATTICSEISAAAIIIGFWNEEINSAVWISVVIVVILALNIYAVHIYGEAEFWFASVKIVTIVGLLLLALIIDLGGAPNHDRLGFSYWSSPGAMNEYLVPGDLGRFLGVLSTLINAAFSYGGVEVVAVAAGEIDNPRKNIPKAVRRVFWRILFFYVLGALAIGVLVPFDDERLLSAQAAGNQTGAASPWVIAIYRAGIPVLPSLVNAVILSAATSSVSAFLYVGSRYLYALAQDRHAPSFLLRCSKSGIPYWCVGITASFSLLAYMGVSTASSQVFTWFYSFTTISSLITWVAICVAYLRFYAALRVHGVDRASLPFRGPCQPYAAWFALLYFLFIILTNGFAVFIGGKWDLSCFLVAYLNIPIFFALYFGWRFYSRTTWQPIAQVNLHAGKEDIDARHWPDRHPRNAFERVWFWIA